MAWKFRGAKYTPLCYTGTTERYRMTREVVMDGVKKQTDKVRYIDLGRAESEIYIPSSDVAEVYEADQHGHGAKTGARKMLRDLVDHGSLGGALAAGDPDADLEDANFVGEEGFSGGNPIPDQDVVEEIGRAAGLNYEDNEELNPNDKVHERDLHRWEMDPASSEDYLDRSRDR